MLENDKKIIYLDYAATTPMRPEVQEAMASFYVEKFGNPSSVHAMGREARSVVDQARAEIAEMLGCEEQEIYFTSGGTEGDNLAILGIARANSKSEIINSKQITNSNDRNSKQGHIITTQIEHQAVLNACKQLEKEGFEVTYLPVNENGVINLDDLKAVIRPETVLVSIMYVNNEIGTVQPIKEIGEILRCAQNDKKNAQNDREGRIYFHTDAVQAAGYFSLDVVSLHVDAMTLSAHKFGGPKGMGLIYLKKDVKIEPIVFGGVQELEVRPGTENVAGILGMAKAFSLAVNERNDGWDKKLLNLRNYFEDQLFKKVPKTMIIGSKADRSPAITSAVFAGFEGAMMVINLDLEGVCVSGGAACSSGSLKISHVIEALNLKKPYDLGAVRFSFGYETTREELDRTVGLIEEIIHRFKSKV